MSVETRKAARLDKALCCDEWRLMFPSSTARHLGHAYSEYFLILMEISGVGAARLGERPFKFQAMWLLHANFFNMMEREWDWNGDLMCS